MKMNKEEKKRFFEQIEKHELVQWSSEVDNLIDCALLFEELQRITNQRRNFGSLPSNYNADIISIKRSKVA